MWASNSPHFILMSNQINDRIMKWLTETSKNAENNAQ